MWRNRPIEGNHPYLYLDGIWLKRTWGGEVRKVALLVAISVNAEGHREILGVCEGLQENKESWLEFLRHLLSRGLSGVRLVVSDKCQGLLEAIHQCLPEAEWQRCIFHFHRNILAKVPRERVVEVAPMLKAIQAQESKEAAKEKAEPYPASRSSFDKGVVIRRSSVPEVLSRCMAIAVIRNITMNGNSAAIAATTAATGRKVLTNSLIGCRLLSSSSRNSPLVSASSLRGW